MAKNCYVRKYLYMLDFECYYRGSKKPKISRIHKKIDYDRRSDIWNEKARILFKYFLVIKTKSKKQNKR